MNRSTVALGRIVFAAVTAAAAAIGYFVGIDRIDFWGLLVTSHILLLDSYPRA